MTKNTKAIDFVSVIGQQIADAHKEAMRMERLAMDAEKHSTQETYYENAREHADDKSYQLHDAITHYEAETLEGALIQMAVLKTFTDQLADISDEQANTYQFKALKRKITRLEHSIINQLSLHTMGNLTEMGFEHLASENCNPFTDVGERLAAIRTERSKPKAA